MRVDSAGAVPVTSGLPAGARGDTRAPQAGQDRSRVADEEIVGAEVKSDQEKAELSRAVDQMNQTLRVFEQNLRLLVHDTTKHIYIQVVDTVTNEVISEFPPKKLLDQLGAIQQTVGLLLDKQG